jgi:hypothetical protein
MWDQISGFLFDNYAIAGLEFENWMWLIGVPPLLVFGYFFERGFQWKTGDTPSDPPGITRAAAGAPCGSVIGRGRAHT